MCTVLRLVRVGRLAKMVLLLVRLMISSESLWNAAAAAAAASHNAPQPLMQTTQACAVAVLAVTMFGVTRPEQVASSWISCW